MRCKFIRMGMKIFRLVFWDSDRQRLRHWEGSIVLLMRLPLHLGILVHVRVVRYAVRNHRLKRIQILNVL